MIHLRTDTSSLAEFTQNTDEFLREMEKTEEPLVLTVDGEPRLVVLDIKVYERLLDRIDRLEAIDGIRRGQMDIKHGRTQPVDEAFEEIRQKYNIPNEV